MALRTTATGGDYRATREKTNWGWRSKTYPTERVRMSGERKPMVLILLSLRAMPEEEEEPLLVMA